MPRDALRRLLPQLTVLTYHRVTPGDGAAPPGVHSATPAGFERQMAWVARSGRAVTIAQVLDAAAGGRALPAGALLVTFDDAYRDFADVAWPIMRRHGIAPLLFVPTAFPDTAARFWWDRLYAAAMHGDGPLRTPSGTFARGDREARLSTYRTLREQVKALPHDEAMAFVDAVAGAGTAAVATVLGWDRLRDLAAEGVALAPHSRSHPRLDRLPADRLDDEIAGSLADLRREIGEVATVFCYPSGGVTAAARAAVLRAGLRLAFTTERGTNDLRRGDPLRLARINVGRRSHAEVLRVQAALPARRPGRLPAAVGAAGEGPVIAYIMSRFPKISETFILTELLAMERAGARVEVFPLLRERAALVHPEAEPVVDRAHYLPVLSPAIVASQLYWLRRSPRAYLGALRDVARGTFGSANFFVFGLGIFPKAAHAARMMRAQGVTHVHCHFATHPAVAGFVIRRLTGLPFSFTAHGSDLHVERRMLPEKVAEASFVATVSDYNRELIIRECGGRFADKVHVVRAGVDTGRFTAARNGDRPPADGPLRILCVGTLHQVKGHRHLVEACRLLAARGVPVRCRLVGDGENRERLAEQIAQANLTGSVELLGSATGPEVAALLRDAHVLVAPSVPTASGKREGIPVVLMEAMSSGLPVVASDLSGIPELVLDGESGILTAPGDAEAIADALARLHADPSLRSALGAAGRRRIEEEFDVRESVGRLLARIRPEATADA